MSGNRNQRTNRLMFGHIGAIHEAGKPLVNLGVKSNIWVEVLLCVEDLKMILSDKDLLESHSEK